MALLLNQPFLKPLTGDVKRKLVAVFDIESKDGDTQKGGFTRPFLASFFDGTTFTGFRNDKSVASLPWEKRHIAPGGCIDKLMRHILGLDGCEKCQATRIYQTELADGSTRKKAATKAGLRLSSRCTCAKLLQRYSSKLFLIYSHNGGKFDELFLLGWLIQNQHLVRFDLASVQSRIQRLDVYRIDKPKDVISWAFLDSYSLLPLSLRKMVQTFDPGGEQKGDLDFDTHEDDPRWDEYNETDCRVLHKSLNAFHNLIEGLGGEVGITAPSTSMKLYRRRFQKSWIYRNQHFPGCDGKCQYSKGLDKRGQPNLCPSDSCDGTCHGCLHEWIRRGYYGGRTELFFVKGRGILYYDINSSYPASMKADMPVGNAIIERKITSEHLLAPLAANHVGFIDCIVEIPKGCPIPPLPFRNKGKLIFPTGKFSGVWDWDELQLLKHPLVNGRIVKIRQSVWYKKKPIFREMVDTLYDFRQKHLPECGGSKACPKPFPWGCKPSYDEGMSYVAKLMLNSLYGKFGMREERTGVMMVPEGSDLPSNGWPINGKLDSLFWECEKVCKASYIIPQISAHITALSRIRLWQGMAEVISKGGRVYYVDTDSIMCDKEIEESGELGGWKREEPHLLLEGEFVLPKLYQLKLHKLDCPLIETWVLGNGQKVATGGPCPGCGVSADGKYEGSIQKMKGVPGHMQTAEVYDDMVHHEGKAEFIRLMQHRGMLNSGALSPKMVKGSKSIRTQYDKRRLNRDGSTTPIHVRWTGKE